MTIVSPHGVGDLAAHLPYRAGVGIMLTDGAGRVWIGHRRPIDPSRPNPEHRLWQMPQGGIDAGEEPEAAAWRELSEETGTDRAVLLGESRDWLTYDLPADVRGNVLGGRHRGQRQKWFALRFTGCDADFDIAGRIPGVAPEFDAWRWAELDELPELVVPFKRSLYVAVVAELRPLVEAARLQPHESRPCPPTSR